MPGLRLAFWQAIGVGAATAVAATVLASAQTSGAPQWGGVLDEHPAIEYANRPTTDRVAKLSQELAGGRSIVRNERTGYLQGVLDALHISVESQLLIFSKTGVQSAYTNPRTPRALYYDQSVVVGYIAGAPLLELAAHDPQQGVNFYTLDQTQPTPRLVRRTSCLTCHVSDTTLDVPGIIARSNTVGADGNILPHTASQNVDHTTGHADRWGGWYVTSEGGPAPYSQRAHMGNITFSDNGITSNQVFVEWLAAVPHERGYLSGSSDAVALLLFDHQSRAINLLTKLNWEARIGERIEPLVNELADYLLFTREAPLPTTLTPNPAYAAYLLARTPKDHAGRSFAELDMRTRLLRYPCSYMIYSEAFDALPAPIRQAVYRRMIERLSTPPDPRSLEPEPSSADRHAILEILSETKSDFPAQ